MIYQILRIWFVSTWFYYSPIIAVLYANYNPTSIYQEKYQNCVRNTRNDCIGANDQLCIDICASKRDPLMIGDEVY